MYGCDGLKLIAMLWTRRCRTLPIVAMDWCGAILVVALFTDGSLVLFGDQRLNVRSNNPRNCRDLCGISAAGDNLKLGGRLCFISDHLVIVAKLSSTFSEASLFIYLSAFLDVADLWFPRRSACSMCSYDQCSPQSTGQPFVL